MARHAARPRPPRSAVLAATCLLAVGLALPMSGTAEVEQDPAPVHAAEQGEITEVAPIDSGSLSRGSTSLEVEVPTPEPGTFASRTAREPVRVTAAGAGAITEVGAVFQSGQASWYGPGFAGNRTANGETYDPSQLTAAHRSLPFNTRVRVTNQRNGRSVVVRVNDRGPFVGGRVIDLSAAAADVIGMRGSGVAPVTLQIAS